MFQAARILVILLLFCNALFSQQTKFSNASVDNIIKRLMDTAGVTGLSIGIIDNGKVEYVKSYGYRNKAAGLLNDTNTVFSAASLSKPVFALLVMQLIDKGMLELDKPLFNYLPKPLPEYDNYKDLAGDDRWKLITARQCLDHTTGFPNWRQLNPNRNKKLQLFFTPGARYAYSGEGLYLLQFVIETITGQKLEDLAQEYILKPFDMSRTSFVWQNEFNANYAVGHNQDEDTLRMIKRVEANAAGSMGTTIANYTRFVSYVLQGKQISAALNREMFSPQIGISTSHQFPSLNNDTTSKYKDIQLSYGLGWGLFRCQHGQAFFKEGHGDDGWEHYVIAFPEKKNGLVIMTNSLNGESIFTELVAQLTGVTIPWEWEGYMPYRPTVTLPEQTLARYAGSYKGKFEISVTLENGRLKIEVPSQGLPKTNLYPASDEQFFIKTIPVNLEFVKLSTGEISKLRVFDEGKVYEFSKVKK
jgi:CubicO group peptidase (beta-lactamase class C family)